MAGHNKGEGIGVAGLPDCPGSAGFAHGFGQLTVGSCFPVGNFGNLLPYPFLEIGALFHKGRSDLRRKFPQPPSEIFPEKIGKTMTVGAFNDVCGPELFFEPLFCSFMSFRGEGEMDREIAEADDLKGYGVAGEGEGETGRRWGWHDCSPGDALRGSLGIYFMDEKTIDQQDRAISGTTTLKKLDFVGNYKI
jgi:hypothetical protein